MAAALDDATAALARITVSGVAGEAASSAETPLTPTVHAPLVRSPSEDAPGRRSGASPSSSLAGHAAVGRRASANDAEDEVRSTADTSPGGTPPAAAVAAAKPKKKAKGAAAAAVDGKPRSTHKKAVSADGTSLTAPSPTADGAAAKDSVKAAKRRQSLATAAAPASPGAVDGATKPRRRTARPASLVVENPVSPASSSPRSVVGSEPVVVVTVAETPAPAPEPAPPVLLQPHGENGMLLAPPSENDVLLAPAAGPATPAPEPPAVLAERMYNGEVPKIEIGQFLGKRNDYSADVLACFVKLYNFAGLSVDAALRYAEAGGRRLRVCGADAHSATAPCAGVGTRCAQSVPAAAHAAGRVAGDRPHPGAVQQKVL